MVDDILNTYNALQSVWSRIRADVFSHAIFAVLIFYISGARLPLLSIPTLNIDALAKDSYFLFAKDTGLIFLLPFLFLLPIYLYFIVFRLFSRFLSSIMMIIFNPTSHLKLFNSNNLNLEDLASLAIAVNDPKFTESSIWMLYGHLSFKYKIKFKADFESFLNGLETRNLNATTYLGNFTLFLVLWCMFISVISPSNDWMLRNHNHSIGVFTGLVVLIIWAWINTKNSIQIVTFGTLAAVSYFVQIDPDYIELFINKELRQTVKERIVSLREKEKDLSPSLFKYINFHLHKHFARVKQIATDPSIIKPNRKTIEKRKQISRSDKVAVQFMRSAEELTAYDNPKWLEKYEKYVFYKAKMYLKYLGTAFWSLVKFYLFGKG